MGLTAVWQSAECSGLAFFAVLACVLRRYVLAAAALYSGCCGAMFWLLRCYVLAGFSPPAHPCVRTASSTPAPLAHPGRTETRSCLRCEPPKRRPPAHPCVQTASRTPAPPAHPPCEQNTRPCLILCDTETKSACQEIMHPVQNLHLRFYS